MATLALFWAVVCRRDWGPWLPAPLILAVVAPTLAYTDLTRGLLPNRVLVPAYTATTAALITAGATVGPLSTTVRALTVSVVVLVVFTGLAVATSGIAGGDVKLLGLIALCLGPDGWTGPGLAILFGFVLASAAVAAHALVAGLKYRPRPVTLPLGPHLLAGALVIVMWKRGG